MSSEQSVSAEIKWVPTDPHGALPGHHWQGTLLMNGECEYQRRYYKKHLALEDAVRWLTRASETEQELASIRERTRS